jgi:dihydroorotate dehydrogenase electron transfer subunit
MKNSTTAARGIFAGRVIHRRTLCDEHFELTFAFDHFPDAAPGQFVQVLCRDAHSGVDSESSPVPDAAASAMLRRPFSIGGLRRESATVEMDLLGRVIGPATAWLDRRKPGDEINVLGPLGRPFVVPTPSHQALLIAGGIGLPPIRWHAEILRKNGVSCHVIFGARERRFVPLDLKNAPSSDGEMTPCSEEFARLGVTVAVTTDDGSLGLRGQVTDAMQRYFSRADPAAPVIVFACGPSPMLRAVGSMCIDRGVPCELAMERVMACGMGTCQSCVVPVVDPARQEGWRYALCCTEGPVFAADAVKWD